MRVVHEKVERKIENMVVCLTWQVLFLLSIVLFLVGGRG